MRVTIAALLSVLLASTCPSSAQNAASRPAADRFVLAKVRLLPKPGSAGLLADARIIGWNWGSARAPEVLARIETAPAGDGWLELPVRSGKVFRNIQFAPATGKAVALAEIEFLNFAGRMAGKSFGTQPGKDTPASTFDKALDGDPKTFFEASAGNVNVGIDLGQETVCPQPGFNPPEGAKAGAVEVTIGTWPGGKAIHYTTDGSPPSATHGQVYSGPIRVSATTSLAAIATQEGLADSEIAIATYRIGQAAVDGPQVRSYHLGNSLTDTVNGFLQPIAASAGKNLLFMRKTVPGCSIRFHWEHNRQGFASPDAGAADYEAVCQKKVDHLFLQPFPNPPGLDDDGEYGGRFIALARKHNADAVAWLYAQWPDRANWKHDAHCAGAGWMKPPWFPPNRNPATWEEAAANKMLYYLEAKKLWDRQIQAAGGKPVRVCPGGPALVRLKKEIDAGKVPGFTTFFDSIFADDIHLAPPGRYLVSLVHYACIFGADPQGKVTYANSGLTAGQAAIFQRIAWETVLAEPLTGLKSEGR